MLIVEHEQLVIGCVLLLYLEILAEIWNSSISNFVHLTFRPFEMSSIWNFIDLEFRTFGPICSEPMKPTIYLAV